MGKINLSKTTFLIIILAVGFFVGVSFTSVYAGVLIDTDDIADNAITSEKIKQRQVKSGDIKNNAVKSNKIRDGTIQGKDIDSTTAITVEQITLDGKITSSGYDFLTTQTRKLTLGANEFQPVLSSTTYSGQSAGAFRFIDAAVGLLPQLMAPLHTIPNGATFTNLSCKVLDNSATKRVFCDILRGDGDGVSTSFGQVSTTDAFSSGTIQTLSDPTVNFVVDRDLFDYHVRFFPTDSDCSTNCRIYQMTVTYTITNAGQ